METQNDRARLFRRSPIPDFCRSISSCPREEIPILGEIACINTELALKSSKPSAEAKLSFAQGMNNKLNKPAIVWQSTITATGNDLPEFPNGIADWITKARAIAHHWFLALTEQHLLKSYK